MPTYLFPYLLLVHVALAVSLFLPSFLLPFTLRTRQSSVAAPQGRVVTALLWLQSNGTVVVGAGIAATGIGMLTILGPTMLEQPWLLVALTIYATNLVLAFFIQRPNLRRLLGITGAADDATWKARARRQRYVSYLMAGLIGTIAFLMSAKPSFW